MKTYHEWGYRFNDSGRIGDLTTTQERVINLAEAAETYIQQVQQDQAQGQYGDYSSQRKRGHKSDIRRRVRELN